MVAIITQSGFITPMDFGVLFLGSLSNFRIVLIQPGLDRFGILFVCPTQGLLGRESPSFQVFANGPNRHVNRPQLFNQLLNRNAGPQHERQLQLVRAFIVYAFLQYLLLLRTQGAAAALRATSLFYPKGFFATVFVKGPPCATDGTANTGNGTDFVMFAALLAKSNDLITNLLLCISAEFSRIYFIHAQLIV
jgi:hypothetical protein